MRNFCLILGTTVLTILLVACSLPAPTEQAPSSAEAAAAYTAAAQTIMAEMTRVVQNQTPAPPLVTGFPAIPGAPTQAEQAAASPTMTQPENSPTPSPTETSTSLPDFSPTPTDVPSDPSLNLGDPDFEDTFKNSSNWALYSDDHISFEIGDEKLIMTAFEPEGWDGWMLSAPTEQDFYLEMVAEPKQCEGLDRYGLVARAVKTKKGYANYLFGVSCDGRYSLRYWDGEKFITQIDWTESEHLHTGPGNTNRLGFYADGESLALYGNGHLLQEIQDDSSLEGKFGVFIGSAETKDFTVQVEKISAWELK